MRTIYVFPPTSGLIALSASCEHWSLTEPGNENFHVTGEDQLAVLKTDWVCIAYKAAVHRKI